MAKGVPNYLRPVGMGHMRETVAVQVPTYARKANGESYVASWATITNGTLRAEMMPLRGDEAFQAQQVFGQEVIQFRVRYKSGVTLEHVLLHNAIHLDIVEIINPGNRNRELLIRCIDRKGDTT